MAKKGKSGAKLHHEHDSKKGLYIWAWKKIPAGMMTAKVFPGRLKNSTVNKKVYSKNGREFIQVYARIQKPFEKEFILSGFYYLTSKTVVFPDWDSVVIMPTAKNGGFFGTLNNNNK